MAVRVSEKEFKKMVKTAPKGSVVETRAGKIVKPRTKRPPTTAKPKQTRVRADGQVETELDPDKKEMFLGVLQQWAPELVPLMRGEYKFAEHLPAKRQWRTDWVFLRDTDIYDYKALPPTSGMVGVAVEIDGGQWKRGGGRHNTDADRWKTNTYAELGLYLLRYSPDMLNADPLGVVRQVRAALVRAGFVLPKSSRGLTGDR